jgi:hypothetical protein
MLHPCPVHEKIYPHRFLLANKAEVEKKRAIVDQLRVKLKVLTDNLQMYRKYDNRDIDLAVMLQQVNSFVTT